MLLVFLSAHPHLLERTKRAEDTASNPGRELSLVTAYYLDLDVLRGDFRDLPL